MQKVKTQIAKVLSIVQKAGERGIATHKVASRLGKRDVSRDLRKLQERGEIGGIRYEGRTKVWVA